MMWLNSAGLTTVINPQSKKGESPPKGGLSFFIAYSITYLFESGMLSVAGRTPNPTWAYK